MRYKELRTIKPISSSNPDRIAIFKNRVAHPNFDSQWQVSIVIGITKKSVRIVSGSLLQNRSKWSLSLSLWDRPFIRPKYQFQRNHPLTSEVAATSLSAVLCYGDGRASTETREIPKASPRAYALLQNRKRALRQLRSGAWVGKPSFPKVRHRWIRSVH